MISTLSALFSRPTSAMANAIERAWSSGGGGCLRRDAVPDRPEPAEASERALRCELVVPSLVLVTRLTGPLIARFVAPCVFKFYSSVQSRAGRRVIALPDRRDGRFRPLGGSLAVLRCARSGHRAGAPHHGHRSAPSHAPLLCRRRPRC